MVKKYYKKEEISFRDIWFRIPGLIICFFSGVGEFYLRLKGTNSDAEVLGQNLPAFLILSGIGLLIFAAPYLELAWNIYYSKSKTKQGEEVIGSKE
jgi:hypothetical protein